ncbi:hypothetical protein LUU34_00324200 [Aix galericulata]|nr:hypothetical protein LUU34_00324200 [Aix galericulata]
MKVEAGDLSAINLSVQQVLSLWAHGTVLRSLTGNRGRVGAVGSRKGTRGLSVVTGLGLTQGLSTVLTFEGLPCPVPGPHLRALPPGTPTAR